MEVADPSNRGNTFTKPHGVTYHEHHRDYQQVCLVPHDVTLVLLAVFGSLEATTAVSMTVAVFCDVTPCSLVRIRRRFGRTYCFLLHRS
jgi:hypothetical protein